MFYLAKNPIKNKGDFIENAIIWLINVAELNAKLYANIVKIVEDLPFFNLKLENVHIIKILEKFKKVIFL